MRPESEDPRTTPAAQLEVTTLLRAIVMLMLDQRETAGDSATPSVLLLHQAGLSNAEIGRVTGRSADAARMAVNRARAASARRDNAADSKEGPNGS